MKNDQVSNHISCPADDITQKMQQIFEETGESCSNIQKFFKGKSIILTGGTGFLGRTIMEKLLRSCPDIDKIYMLVRTKAEMNPSDRIKELFEDILFMRLKKEYPNAYNKIVAISSEMSQPNLALSQEDRKVLVDNVSIIIHSAATVRFDEPLSVAGNINVRGTVELLKLARECKNLAAFTHISTTFCHCKESETTERFYEPPIDYRELLEILKLEENIIRKLEPKLLNGLPNTYVYTKATAEDAVRQLSVGLPVTIVRPCIVISTSREPIPGWTDKKYPPGFIFTGAAIGFIRVQLIENTANADLVPVDMTANSIISATYDTAIRFQNRLLKEVPIYNYSNYDTNPVTWEVLVEIGKKKALTIPSMKCLWYYSDCRTNSMTVFRFYDFFLHLIPAVLLDCFRYIIRKKPKYFQIYKRMQKSIDVISYFVCRKWKFRNPETQSLWNRQSQIDKIIFPFDMSQLDWSDYVETQNRAIMEKLLRSCPGVNKIYMLVRNKADTDSSVRIKDLFNDIISIIIHSVATVLFDKPLSIAGNINVKGTIEMIKLARECKNLEVFTHISTTFCHCRKLETQEQFYDSPMDY